MNVPTHYVVEDPDETSDHQDEEQYNDHGWQDDTSSNPPHVIILSHCIRHPETKGFSQPKYQLIVKFWIC